MNPRPPLTNVFSVEYKKDRQRRVGRSEKPTGPVHTTEDDSKAKDKRPIQAERRPTRATSPGPPVRANQSPPKVIPSRMRKIPIASQFQSKSAAEHSSTSVVKIGGTMMVASAVLTRRDLDAIQTEIKLFDIRTTGRSPLRPTDIRQLHSRLSKGKLQMTFQCRHRDESTHLRKPSETVKSGDSGTFSIPEDDDVVEVWRPEWQKIKTGSAPGEFRGIKGLCFTEDGNVAIAEEKNARIQITDKKRGESYTIIQDTSLLRRMNLGGICQLPDRKFLAATDRQRVIYFEPSTDGLRKWRAFDDQIHLQGIAVNSREQLFLTDLEKKRVYTYDISGKRILKFKPDDFLRPEYIAVSEEYSMVFVSDSEQGCVYMLNMDGELLNKIGRQGDEQETLICPMGVCCQPNGKLIVADRAQNRLFTYDFRAQSYEHLLPQGELLCNPTCIATDGDRYLAVAEENHDFKVDEYGFKMFYKCS